MDGRGSTGLSDIGRWKTLPPARPASTASEDADRDAGHDANLDADLVDALTAAARGLEKAVTQDAWALGEVGLAASMAVIGRIRSLVDQLEVTVTAEVLSRRTAQPSGLSVVDWLVEQQGADAPRPDLQLMASV